MAAWVEDACKLGINPDIFRNFSQEPKNRDTMEFKIKTEGEHRSSESPPMPETPSFSQSSTLSQSPLSSQKLMIVTSEDSLPSPETSTPQKPSSPQKTASQKTESTENKMATGKPARPRRSLKSQKPLSLKGQPLIKSPIPTAPLKIKLANKRKLASIPAQTYNLRPSRLKKRRITQEDSWIDKKGPCFRDEILSKRNLRQAYFDIKDDINAVANEIIGFTDNCAKSQIDRFTFDKSEFFVLSCLNSARIFEFSDGYYSEVKRIPKRKIELSSNILTSIHYDDSKLYMAYLWGSPNENEEPKEPYLEIRDIYGELLSHPYTYDYPIKSIGSDGYFIYLMTTANILYVHRKVPLFKVVKHRIDLNSYAGSPIIGVNVHQLTTKGYTRLVVFFATLDKLVILLYDALDHKLQQCYRFNDSLKIKSYNIIAGCQKIVILRSDETDENNTENSKCQSRLEVGQIQRFDNVGGYYFVHEVSISFNQYIIESKIDKDQLFLYGFSTNDGVKHHEIICLELPSFKMRWSAFVLSVNSEYRMIIHDSHIALVKNHDKFAAVMRPKKWDTNKCQGCRLNFASQEDAVYHKRHSHISIGRNLNISVIGTNSPTGSSKLVS